MNQTIIRVKTKAGKYAEYPISKEEVTVGRSVTADISIDDASVSRIHFRLIKQGDDYLIVDNQSSNGTYLQKRKIRQELLQDGDDIYAGRVHVYYANKKDSDATEIDPGQETVDLSVTDFAKTAAFKAVTATPSMEAPTPPGGVPLHSFPQTPPPPLSQPVAPPAPQPPAPEPGYPPQMPPAQPSAPQPIAPQPVVPPPMVGMPIMPEAPQSLGTPPAMAPVLDEEGFASPIHRLLAIIIDGVLAGLLMAPVMGLAISGVLTNMAIYWALYAITMLLLILHPIVGWMVYGKTLGKHFLGLRIVMDDDPQRRGITIKALIMRFLGYMLSGMLLYIPFIFVITDPDGRGFHDKLAGTRVVKKI